MAASEAGQCRRGDLIGPCRDQHVRRLIPSPRRKSGSDKDCPLCHKPLSVNIGTKGMRFVWCCGTPEDPGYCDPAMVRAVFVGQYGIDEMCLGNYGSDAWATKESRKLRDQVRPTRIAPSTLAAERKFYVIEKLYARKFESVALLKVCIRAVIESDGNVSPDPEHLLPRDYIELAALARRAGVERKYSYKFAREWLEQVAAVTS